jgi:hypothetical protein
VKRGSTYESVTHPDQTIFQDPAVDVVYQGGHNYPITDAEAVLLLAAGYTPTLEV